MNARASARLLLTCLALLLTGAAAEEELHKGDQYLAQMLFYRVDQATVVYPAAPGEDAARNRLSANHRARYFESLTGTKTRVVSDAEVTEQDLAGHLLVLGWGNRILGTGKAPRPFERTGAGTRFLGLTEPDPSVALMLFHASPFNQERYLMFWSRIDPVSDRFMPLPMLGSDWAFYRDFKVIRQGMFRPGLEWPPRRDPEAEKDHSADMEEARAGETRKRGAHYDLVYDPARIGTDEAEAILRTREAAFSKAAAALGSPAEGYRALLFVYADDDAKKNLTGVPEPAHALLSKRELHMTRRAARSSSAHEEYHLVAHETLGPCHLTSLYEGLAVSLEGTYGGVDLETHGAILLEKEKVPTLAEALDEERVRKGPPEVALPAVGLVVSWLRGALGREALRKAYTMPEGSAAALEKAIGRPAAALQADFRGWVVERASARQSDVAFLKAEAEARDRYLVGDYAGVAAALARAHALKPGDPQTLFNLASAELRSAAYAEAEKHLRLLLERATKASDSRFVIFAHYQLGRLYDVQGRRQEALEEYRRVLELPDQHEAHRLAREALDTPVTKEQLR